MFNWMLGQLRKVVGRSYIRGKALNLNRLSSVREKAKPHPQPNSIIRTIPSYMCVQLDARPVKKGYREIVCSWKSSELESAEKCTPHPQSNSVFAQFSAVYMFNWMLGQLRKAVGRSYVRGKAPNLNRLSCE